MLLVCSELYINIDKKVLLSYKIYYVIGLEAVRVNTSGSILRDFVAGKSSRAFQASVLIHFIHKSALYRGCITSNFFVPHSTFMMTPEETKTAIITGSGKGIGKETAILLAKRGVNVVVCSRSESEIDSVVDEIEKLTGHPRVLSVRLILLWNQQ